jgi:hypothetical protein
MTSLSLPSVNAPTLNVAILSSPSFMFFFALASAAPVASSAMAELAGWATTVL